MGQNDLLNLITDFNNIQAIIGEDRYDEIINQFSQNLTLQGNFYAPLDIAGARYYVADTLVKILSHNRFLRSVFNNIQHRGEVNGISDSKLYKTFTIDNGVRQIYCEDVWMNYDDETGTPDQVEEATLRFEVDQNNQIINATMQLKVLFFANGIREEFTYNVIIPNNHPFFQVLRAKEELFAVDENAALGLDESEPEPESSSSNDHDSDAPDTITNSPNSPNSSEYESSESSPSNESEHINSPKEPNIQSNIPSQNIAGGINIEDFSGHNPTGQLSEHEEVDEEPPVGKKLHIGEYKR
jgi:hypothetical protein